MRSGSKRPPEEPPQAQAPVSSSLVEETARRLVRLTDRLTRRALFLWKGITPSVSPDHLYDGAGDLLTLETLELIDRAGQGPSGRRIRHALMDHYLQQRLLPYETELWGWMRGAAAHVNDEKIYLRQIIPWCQKSSTYEGRQKLQKETGPLCKFLRPFALQFWEVLLETLQKDLGYPDYLTYCAAKKEVDYASWYRRITSLLEETDAVYFPAMEKWCLQSLGRPLGELTRFDAIYLLSLSELDPLFPPVGLGELIPFLSSWLISPGEIPHLHLDLDPDPKKSAQAMCFVLHDPLEVHVLIQPQGGWVDLEALFHELGHGLSAAMVSPDLPLTDRSLATTSTLSETFAFLLQNVTFSPPFLEDFLGLPPQKAEAIRGLKLLKDLSVFRRYGAKFLAEYEIFSRGDLSDGSLYAGLMGRHTGFSYQAEAHLFDLVPEFYCLDYVMAWMGEAMVAAHLEERFGPRWMLTREAGELLRQWWAEGNRLDLEGFLQAHGMGPVTEQNLLERWKQGLGGQPAFPC